MTTTPALPLLDELDELRAKATPGEWHVAKNGSIDAGEYDTVIGGGPVDCMSHCYGGVSTLDGDNLPADAALIVAAVNRLPELTAALRAVLELADNLTSYVAARGLPAPGTYDDGVNRAQSAVAADLRAAITTALEASS